MLVMLLATASLVWGKTVNLTVNIGKDADWKYLTKFHLGVGTGQFIFKARLSRPLDFKAPVLRYKLAIFLEEPWLNVVDQDVCHAKLSEASLVREVEIPVKGEWSLETSGILTQSQSDRMWFFALADCDITAPNMKRNRLKVDFQVINSDGSHFSLEDQHQMQDCLLLAVVSILVSLGCFKEVLSKWRKRESIELVQIMLMLSIASASASLVLKALHLYMYSFDGSGFLAIDFFAESLEVLSSIILTVILILISSGWLLQYSEFPEPETYIPVSILIFIVNLLIVGIGRISDDSWDKSTDYQGLPGFMFLMIRLGMWSWVHYNVNYVLNVKKHSEQRFLRQFNIAVTCYFWSLLVIIVSSWAVPSTSRQRFVVVSLWLVQMTAILTVSSLFQKKSTFYKMSAMSSSELPGIIG
jgi:uncharacterized membrane protein YphA (DoxX/SURF4 family)